MNYFFCFVYGVRGGIKKTLAWDVLMFKLSQYIAPPPLLPPQPALTYSKIAIETLEQGVKYVKYKYVKYALVFLLLTSNM